MPRKREFPRLRRAERGAELAARTSNLRSSMADTPADSIPLTTWPDDATMAGWLADDRTLAEAAERRGGPHFEWHQPPPGQSNSGEVAYIEHGADQYAREETQIRRSKIVEGLRHWMAIQQQVPSETDITDEAAERLKFAIQAIKQDYYRTAQRCEGEEKNHPVMTVAFLLYAWNLAEWQPYPLVDNTGRRVRVDNNDTLRVYIDRMPVGADPLRRFRDWLNLHYYEHTEFVDKAFPIGQSGLIARLKKAAAARIDAGLWEDREFEARWDFAAALEEVLTKGPRNLPLVANCDFWWGAACILKDDPLKVPVGEACRMIRSGVARPA